MKLAKNNKIIDLPTVNDDAKLTFLEGKNLPFSVKRIYYISGADPNLPRGYHAHKTNKQFLICLQGSLTLVLDDGQHRETLVLNNPQQGVLVANNVWHEMHDFKRDTILLVLASENYNESDYIRIYPQFHKYIRNNGHDPKKTKHSI